MINEKGFALDFFVWVVPGLYNVSFLLENEISKTNLWNITSRYLRIEHKYMHIK